MVAARPANSMLVSSVLEGSGFSEVVLAQRKGTGQVEIAGASACPHRRGRQGQERGKKPPPLAGVMILEPELLEPIGQFETPFRVAARYQPLKHCLQIDMFLLQPFDPHRPLRAERLVQRPRCELQVVVDET